MAKPSLDAVLRAHGVQFDGAALSTAFRDPEHGPGLEEWVKDRLGADNLLANDEFAVYANLEKGGQVDNWAARDLSVTLGLNDRELEDAIEQLNLSTNAIKQQTETLKQQHDALSRLVQTQTKNLSVRSAMEVKLLQKQTSEWKSLTSMVTELEQKMEYRVADLEPAGKTSGFEHLDHSVDAFLESDDKLLASLQKLVWELETEDPEEEDSVEKLREICARLIKFTVETIRTKLDRIFLESLQAAKRSNRHEEASREQVQGLQEEVESLFSEILPVAQMSVEQQYLEPALKSLSEKNGRSVTRTSEAIVYIDQCLDYILDRIRNLTQRVSQYQTHQDAIATILAAAKDELASQVEPPTASTEDRPPPPSFASRRRRSSGGASPVRKRITRRRSSGGRYDEMGASHLDALLDHLALSLVPDESVLPVTPGPNAPHAAVAHTNPTNPAQVTAEHARRAAEVLTGRQEKAADVGRSVQEAMEFGASAYVADASRAVQMLRDEILGETLYGKVSLIDPEIEGSMAVLRQEVEKVKSRAGEVEEAVSTLEKSVKKKEFVDRWRG